MLLSILIPTTYLRQDMTMRLVDSILDQVEQENVIGLVEVITLYDRGEKPTGTKRNELIQQAKGKYVCFVDSDDEVSKDYIKLLFEGIETDADCFSLRGVITVDGNNPEIFEHSIKYNLWKTNDSGVPKYERYINHLNCVKKEIAQKVKYADIVFGEDRDWSDKLRDSGLIKTEHYIDSVLYHYKFITNK